MKKLLLLLMLVALCGAAFAQYTNVTATITSPTSVIYQNCYGDVTFVNQSNLPQQPLLHGSVFQTTVPISGCNSFGQFTVRLADNLHISPGPSQWQFNICDHTKTYCFSSLQTVTGYSVDLSTQLSQASAPLPQTGVITQGLPPYITPQFSVSGPSQPYVVLGKTHKLANQGLVVVCYDTSQAGIQTQIRPGAVTINPISFDVTITFAARFTGYCVVNGGIGPPGPVGLGLPAGGGTNTVLAKNSASDYDTSWINNPTFADLTLTDASCTSGTVVKGDGTGCTAATANLHSPGTIGDTIPGIVYSTDSITSQGPVVNVVAYGAVGDGQVATDCSMTAGSAVVSCATGHFTANDVGKVIGVYGAGATVSGFTKPLPATISSYTDAQHITLGSNAVNNVTNSSRVVWGTNNTVTIQNAVNAAALLGAATVYFPPGLWLTNIIDMPCSAAGQGGNACNASYNGIRLHGDTAQAAAIENWNPDFSYTGHLYAGGSGLVVLGGAYISSGSGTDIQGVEIDHLTLRQVTNSASSAAKVIYGTARVHDNVLTGTSYECAVSSGTGDYFYNNTLIGCGNGGPGYTQSISAINLNGTSQVIENNTITGSGQCFESGARHNTYIGNICDATGVTASPNLCMNIGNTGAGAWDILIEGNTCKNFGSIGTVANGNGTLNRITIQGNTFIDSGSIALQSGVNANTVVKETDTVVHGTSYLKNNTFTYSATNTGKLYGFSIGGGNNTPQYAQEAWVADGNTIRLPNWNADSIGFAVQFSYASFPGWQPSHSYTAINAATGNGSAYAQPTAPNGYYYAVTTTGTSGSSEPTWCTTASCTVTDGTAVWTLQGKKPQQVVSNNRIDGPQALTSFNSDIVFDGTLMNDVALVNNTFNYPAWLYRRNAPTGFGWNATIATKVYDRSPIPTNRPHGTTNSMPWYDPGYSPWVDSTPQYGRFNIGDHITKYATNGGWTVNRAGQAAPIWQASLAYGYNNWVVPTIDNGHFYRTQAACTSNSSEPTWPTGAGTTVADNTCTWVESGTAAGFAADANVAAPSALSIPTNASGYLNNNGSGTLSWSTPTVTTTLGCSVGLWNGGTAITAGTYSLPARCLNVYGHTYTITGIKCYSNNNGTSTGNVSDNSSNALLTGAITATSSWAAGTQSATTTIANGAWTNWTLVADGTSTTVECMMTIQE